MIKRLVCVGSALCALAGCSDNKPDPIRGEYLTVLRACSADADCEENQLCIFRICGITCADDSQCSGGRTCIDTGRGNACTRLSDNACESDLDCPARMYCSEKKCASPCETGTGDACPPGLTCVDGSCTESVPNDAGASSDPAEPPPTSNGSPARGSTAGTGGVGGRSQQPMAAGRGSGLGGSGAGGNGAGGNGTSGAGGRSQPPAQAGSSAGSGCPVDLLECRDNVVLRCDSRGQFQPAQTCRYLCRDGACSGWCKPDEGRCSGRVLMHCDANGTWRLRQLCDGSCMATGCVAASCSDGAHRCEGQYLAVCRGGQWMPERLCSYQCKAASCSGECTPGQTRCDGDALATCEADAYWGAARPCSDSCVDDACVLQSQACAPGLSPDWYSTPQAGGDPTLDDGRWGAGGLVPFSAGVAGAPGGYVIVYDRALAELAVTLRSTLGPNEQPTAQDSVYFGITTNQAGAPSARSLTLTPVELASGAGPEPLVALNPAEFQTGWSASASASWVDHVAEWRNGTNGAALSWAISFRVKLRDAGVDATKPFRIALYMRLAGLARDLSTPADFASVADRPADWPVVQLDLACAGRARLQ